MATALASILAPVDATLTAAAPLPAWHKDPCAMALIASCVLAPPTMEYRASDWSRDGHYYFTGYRAECLNAIREEYGAAALTIGDDTGDYAAFEAWQAEPSVFDAIEGARNAVTAAAIVSAVMLVHRSRIDRLASDYAAYSQRLALAGER